MALPRALKKVPDDKPIPGCVLQNYSCSVDNCRHRVFFL